MPVSPKAETIRRIEMTWTIGGRTHPYVFFAQIGSRSEKAIWRMKLKNPSSVYLIYEPVIQGWNAFIPRWCSPQRPKRFLSIVGRRAKRQILLQDG